MAKIAAADRTALNTLYRSEVAKFGRQNKRAADDKFYTDNQDPDAFRDHEDYIETIEAVLKADKRKPDWNPNDPILD